MRRVQKTILVILVLNIIIGLVTPLSSSKKIDSANNTLSKDSFFRFHSYMMVEYDSTILNKDIQPDISISVPIQVYYKTDVPNDFLRFVPWQIRNWIIFGSMMGSMQTIHLEIADEPEHANIYISTPDLLVDILFGEEVSTISTTLVLSVHMNAPAELHSFLLKAHCDDIGIISGCSYETTICFTPAWVPLFHIESDQYHITAPAGSYTNAKIEITNNGNADAIVYGEYSSIFDGWDIILNPEHILIASQQTKTMTMHIGIPDDCMNCMIGFNINFYGERPNQSNKTKYIGSLDFTIRGYSP